MSKIEKLLTIDAISVFEIFTKLEEFANDIYRKYLERKNGRGEN